MSARGPPPSPGLILYLRRANTINISDEKIYQTRYNEDGTTKNSQSQTAEILKISRGQVCRACDRVRHGKTKRLKFKQGHEERRPRVHKDDDVYIITSGDRSCRITEDNLRYLKKLYCLEKLTINEVARELRIPRRDFYLIKTAFGITKDDVPYIDEDLINNDAEDLAADSLQEQKRLYFIKMDQKEVQDMRHRLDTTPAIPPAWEKKRNGATSLGYPDSKRTGD